MLSLSSAHRIALALLATALTACGTPQVPPATFTAASAPSQLAPLTVRHVVLLKLKERSDRPQLERACDEQLSAIPGVVEYSIGRPVDTGRPIVDGDYDVAVYVGFPSVEAYRGYLVHPKHVALVSAWKDKFQSMRIYDFGND